MIVELHSWGCFPNAGRSEARNPTERGWEVNNWDYRDGKSKQQLRQAGSNETQLFELGFPQTHSPDRVTQQVIVLGRGKG